MNFPTKIGPAPLKYGFEGGFLEKWKSAKIKQHQEEQQKKATANAKKANS